MFDRFAFGMEVLNAWFSHSLEEKLHSFPLPFDCWQTNQISFACAWAFSSFLTILTMMSKVRQWCLMLPGLSSSPMKTNSYVNWICQIQGSAKDRDTLWEFPLKGLPYVHLNRRRPPPKVTYTEILPISEMFCLHFCHNGKTLWQKPTWVRRQFVSAYWL